MPQITLAAGIGLAISAASAGFAVKSSFDQAKHAKKAAKAQEQAQRLAQGRAELATRKARRQQLREARIRRAQIIQSGINAGVGLGSTATQTAVGGIGTQFGSNIGDISQAQSISTKISEQNRLSARAQTKIGQSQAAAGG